MIGRRGWRPRALAVFLVVVLCLVAGLLPGDNAGYAVGGQAEWRLVAPEADWLNPPAGMVMIAVSGLSGIFTRLPFRRRGARGLKPPPPGSVRRPGPVPGYRLRLRT